MNGHNSRGGIAGGRPFEPLEKRYAIEDRGYETPCWIWRRTLTRKGYGIMWDPGRKRLVPAHRYFYEHFVGPIPEGLQFDHLCRVHACVNPTHGEPVTQYVNQQRGVNAKLTREQADEIRRRGLVGAAGRRKGRQSGESIGAIAREFGVSWPIVDGIVQGRFWP